jgi:hypothetical protein
LFLGEGKEMTLEEIKKHLRQIDPNIPEDDPDYPYFVILLSSIWVGTDPEKLAAFTGYDLALIQAIWKRMCAAKIWDGDTIECEDWYEGGLGLALAMLVARGEVIRRWLPKITTWRYCRVDCATPETSEKAA